MYCHPSRGLDISDLSCPLQFVVAAALSLISSLFIRAHHLSDKAKAAILGVDRAKQQERELDTADSTQAVELRERQS
jgi:hypothetical protein